jgi:amidase
LLPVDDHGAFVEGPALLLAGASTGPLEGTTLGVKDLFDVAGTVTRAGNPDYASGRSLADASATAVERLVAAGASVVGRTVSDELAFSLSGTNVHDGTPVNPAAPGRVPGGSSAGSAVAVAAGLVDIGLGTDTGGSIRVPASYCGVVGWRPTHGRVPLTGVVPLAPSFDTVGAFTRNVELLERVANTLLSRADTATAGSDVRVVAESALLLRDGVAESFDAACAGLDAAGSTVFGIDFDEAFDAFRTRQQWEAWNCHGRWIEECRPRFGPGISQRFTTSSRVAASSLGPADVVRDRIRATLVEATANGTVLLVPAAAGPAPPLQRTSAAHDDDRMRTLRLGCLAGLAGAPVVVLPGAEVDGLPFGVAAIGAPGSDRALLAWARTAIEAMKLAGAGHRTPRRFESPRGNPRKEHGPT